MKYKVLQKFLTKRGVYVPGDVYDCPTPGKFTKNLVKYGFIEQVSDHAMYEEWEKNGIKSKLANLIIAPEDYAEGDKRHFTWEKAVEIEKKLNNGWRLPTRSEWVLICEEFGQKDGGPDADTLIKNIGVGRHGLVITDGLRNAGHYGYYWSSSPYSDGTSAYLLYFYSGYLYPSNYYNRYGGFSVRLVKDLETQPLDTSKRGE